MQEKRKVSKPGALRGTGRHNPRLLTWTAWVAERLHAMGSPYAPHYHSGLEAQVMPVTDDDELTRFGHDWPVLGTPRPVRTVVTGESGEPIRSNDGPVDYHPDLILCAGTSWWNWKERLTEAAYLDFDYGHGGSGLDDDGIARVDKWAQRLPYVANIASKSGRGRHWFVRLATPLPAPTRKKHSFNCRRVRQKISVDLGFDIEPFVCACDGAIQYIYARYARTKVERKVEQDDKQQDEQHESL